MSDVFSDISECKLANTMEIVQNGKFFYNLRTIDALHSPEYDIQFQPYPIHENNINVDSINSLSKQQWYLVVQGMSDPSRWLNQAICRKWFQNLMLLFCVILCIITLVLPYILNGIP